MSGRSPRTPSYRHHKPSNQAVVTLNGRDVYLGVYDTPASRAEYDRVIAEWLAAGRRPPAGAGGQGVSPSELTINELIVAYVRFAEGYYRKGGEPTGEADTIRYALRPLHRLYGPTEAREFGPLALQAVRQAMIESGLCRNECNRRTRIIVRAFGWAVSRELVAGSVTHALREVKGLAKGRSEARETDPVKPVPEAFVDAVRPFVSRQVWAMIELQRLTGMRPGEVCQMRTGDLNTSGRVWEYTPQSHKTEHHGKGRTIYLGPRAQEILKPWLRPDLSDYLFSPREAMGEFLAERKRNAKAPTTPARRARRRKKRPLKTPGARYDVESYRRAVQIACDKAFPHPTLEDVDPDSLAVEQRRELREWRRSHHWHPNRLRHNAATYIRREFGLDIARVILGHSSPVTTELYAEADRTKAVAAMLAIG